MNKLEKKHQTLLKKFKSVKRIKEAEENYKRAIKIKPDFAEACFNLGNIFMETESFDDAIEIYRRTIKINPQL